MSFFGFNIAGSALDAFQSAENTTSNNIANVNTPGASRQVANLDQAPPIVGSPGYATWQGPGTQGDGVLVSSITRIHQDSYDTLFRGASSSQNFFDVQSQQLQAVQASFAEPNSGINTAFAGLQTALSQLSSNPTGTAERSGVITAAQTLVNQLNNVGQAVQSGKATAIQQATTVVSQANDLIDKIAALNGQIRASKAIGDNPNTYQDQRDADVDQLSKLLSTQSAIQSNGSTLVTVGGRALVNDTVAYHLAAPVVGTDSSGNPTLVIGFANDPNPSNPNPAQVGSGQLGAYLDLYNNKLTPYGQQLDSFANATAAELNTVTQAGYDLNGTPGQALLQPVVSSQAISATNIKVGISNSSQVTAALASTSAGTLTTSMNAGTNVVNTAQAVAGNTSLANPGVAAGATGTLTVTVDGIAQTFAYDFTANGTDSTVDKFVAHFNAAQLGVTAAFDQSSQKIVFTRDPNNESLAHRAAILATPGAKVAPPFSISDSNFPVTGSLGTPTTSLLQVLGASGLEKGVGGPPPTSYVGVPQDNTNAFGVGDNGAANALLRVFSASVGVPSLQTTGATAVGIGAATVAPTAGQQTFAAIKAGQSLTLDGGTANQENVVVTAVNRSTGTISFTTTKAHAVGFSITTAQTQTLGSYYGSLVSQVGLDTQTATTGSSTQQKLAGNIDSVRQSIDGINIDEETQNLVKYQNSYQAAAKTMNVIEQLLTSALGLIPGG